MFRPREATEKVSFLGGKICIFDLDSKRGEKLERELGENCAYFSVDVCHEANIKEAINEVIKQFNIININVNCAGIALAEKTLGKDGPHDLTRFKKIIDVNLIGTFNIWIMQKKWLKTPLIIIKKKE